MTESDKLQSTWAIGDRIRFVHYRRVRTGEVKKINRKTLAVQYHHPKFGYYCIRIKEDDIWKHVRELNPEKYPGEERKNERKVRGHGGGLK